MLFEPSFENGVMLLQYLDCHSQATPKNPLDLRTKADPSRGAQDDTKSPAEFSSPKGERKLIGHFVGTMFVQTRSRYHDLASNTLTHLYPDVSIRAAYQGATIA